MWMSVCVLISASHRLAAASKSPPAIGRGTADGEVQSCTRAQQRSNTATRQREVMGGRELTALMI